MVDLHANEVWNEFSLGDLLSDDHQRQRNAGGSPRVLLCGPPLKASSHGGPLDIDDCLGNDDGEPPVLARVAPLRVGRKGNSLNVIAGRYGTQRLYAKGKPTISRRKIERLANPLDGNSSLLALSPRSRRRRQQASMHNNRHEQQDQTRRRQGKQRARQQRVPEEAEEDDDDDDDDGGGGGGDATAFDMDAIPRDVDGWVARLGMNTNASLEASDRSPPPPKHAAASPVSSEVLLQRSQELQMQKQALMEMLDNNASAAEPVLEEGGGFFVTELMAADGDEVPAEDMLQRQQRQQRPVAPQDQQVGDSSASFFMTQFLAAAAADDDGQEDVRVERAAEDPAHRSPVKMYRRKKQQSERQRGGLQGRAPHRRIGRDKEHGDGPLLRGPRAARRERTRRKKPIASKAGRGQGQGASNLRHHRRRHRRNVGNEIAQSTTAMARPTVVGPVARRQRERDRLRGMIRAHAQKAAAVGVVGTSDAPVRRQQQRRRAGAAAAAATATRRRANNASKSVTTLSQAATVDLRRQARARPRQQPREAWAAGSNSKLPRRGGGGKVTNPRTQRRRRGNAEAAAHARSSSSAGGKEKDRDYSSPLRGGLRPRKSLSANMPPHREVAFPAIARKQPRRRLQHQQENRPRRTRKRPPVSAAAAAEDKENSGQAVLHSHSAALLARLDHGSSQWDVGLRGPPLLG